MHRHLLTILILALAFALYTYGLVNSAMGAVLLGGASELWFWVRIFRKPALQTEQV